MCQNHYFWWLWSECSPLPIPNREVKPHIADDTALVCGKVGRRQSFKEHSERDALFLRKFRDLATPTLLHFGNAQASLALRSTSAAPIMGEVRYNSLMKTFFTGLDSIQRCSVPLTGYPQEAEELFVATERNAKLRYEGYKKLSEM